MEGEATVNKQPVKNHLLDANGEPLPVSAEAIVNDLAEVRPGKAPTKAQAKTAEEFDERVDELVKRLTDGAEGHQLSDVDGNLEKVVRSAMERYKDHPELIDEDRFYEQWEKATGQMAGDGITQDQVATAAALLSPGVEAAANLRYTQDLVTMVRNNPPLSSLDRNELLNKLETDAKACLTPSTNEDGTLGTLRADRIAQANALRFAADEIRAGRMTNMNDLPSDAGARFAHLYRKQYGPQGDMPDGLPDFYTSRTENPGAGFGVGKGYTRFASAIAALKGNDVDVPLQVGSNPRRWANQYGAGIVSSRTSDMLLNDIKVRSFHNNILDPHDARGRGGDVTIDFHMEDAAFMALGTNSNTSWEGGATIGGVKVGTRAHVADATRRQVDLVSRTLGEPNLPVSRVQEIVWAEWKRLQNEGFVPYVSNPTSPPAPLPILDLRPES